MESRSLAEGSGWQLDVQWQVHGVPDMVYYVPHFVSNEEEVALLREVYAAPKPKWVSLSNRRLQNWGGALSAKGLRKLSFD